MGHWTKFIELTFEGEQISIAIDAVSWYRPSSFRSRSNGEMKTLIGLTNGGTITVKENYETVKRRLDLIDRGHE